MAQFGFGQSGSAASASRPGGNSQKPGSGFHGGPFGPNPFGSNPFGPNPFAGSPGGSGFHYSGRGPENMSPEEFMTWYRTTFADAFRDLDEVLRRSGARVYNSRSNPTGRGPNRGSFQMHSLVHSHFV
jgi:hypothetical protein